MKVSEKALRYVALYTLLLLEGAILPTSSYVIVRQAGDDVFSNAASQVSIL